MEPGVFADTGAVRGWAGEPFGHAGLGDADELPVAAVHLLAHLQGIAPVGEDRGLLGQHRRGARRALEAGEPRQPLRIGADIFAHMLVGQRDDEAVESLAGELVAQGGEAGGLGRHRVAFRFSISGDAERDGARPR